MVCVRIVGAAGILFDEVDVQRIMRRLSSLVFAAIVMCVVGILPHRAAAQVHMNITGAGGQTWQIAVSGLKNLGGDDSQTLSAKFDQVLSRDLQLSGYFTMVDAHTFMEDPQKSGYDLGQFNFADWSSIRAELLVKGAIQISGDKVQLTAMLFDVYQQRRLMGKTYNGSSVEVPRMARRFADAILKTLTGVQGPFDTRIAFVSTRAGRFKEIYTQSIDGGDLFQVTNNPTINLFPSWDRDANQLLYLSYKSMAPALYLANLSRRNESKIDTRHGRFIGGSISPDGQSIVAAEENGGATNLFLLDYRGREIRELTHTGGINVSPNFSLDGQTLAFTSDRSGAPQIYTMSKEGGTPTRITYSGDYNTTPAISPKGDMIAYQSRNGGRFDIYVIPIGGGSPTKVTDGSGSNESASWSPDGRYLLFSSTRGGRLRLYILQVESHKIISAVTEDNGNDSNPAWSWWFGD